ncbi:MAG TPA: peptide ABC transporter permease [Chloroflexi bacterium]|nr:peptide ABC transporter permease [Chloroflexota bacterium]
MVDTAIPPATTGVATVEIAPRRRPGVLHFFLQHRLAALGSVVLLVLGLVALFASVVAPYDPDAISLDILAPPRAAHLLGTDDVGRDMLSRLVYAARISLTVGVVSSIITVILGVALGSLAGYYGGWIDTVISSFINIMLSIPVFPLALVLGSFLETNLRFIVLIIGFLSWMGVARIIRAEYLSLKEREFVQAARVTGVPTPGIVIRHILPNTLGPIIVAATLQVANGILLESALSYLGYGIQPPTPSWGNMLQNAQRYLRTAPAVAVYPGALISLTVISINFVGDGLRDALDPRLRE